MNQNNDIMDRQSVVTSDIEEDFEVLDLSVKTKNEMSNGMNNFNIDEPMDLRIQGKRCYNEPFDLSNQTKRRKVHNGYGIFDVGTSISQSNINRNIQSGVGSKGMFFILFYLFIYLFL